MPTETASEFAARRIREERQKRRWKTGDLAARCAEAGYPWVTENVIKELENGRYRDGRRTRRVVIDEVYAFARAFDCSPMNLLPAADGGGGQLGPMTEETIEEVITTLNRWVDGIKAQRRDRG